MSNIGLPSKTWNGGIGVTSYFRTTAESDTYPVGIANLVKGGVHSVANIAERNAISPNRRAPYMLCVVGNVGQSTTKLYWLLGETDAELANNNNWSEVPLGLTINGALSFIGFLDGTNPGILDSAGANGDTYIVDVAGVVNDPNIFNGEETTLTVADYVIYDGTNSVWYHISRNEFGITWNTLPGKPATFTPENHTHTVSDITDFPNLNNFILNSQVISVIDTETPDNRIPQVTAIKNYVENEISNLPTNEVDLSNYYSKSEVNNLLSKNNGNTSYFVDSIAELASINDPSFGDVAFVNDNKSFYKYEDLDTDAWIFKYRAALTSAEVKAYYEANSNTNAFTDALLNKLNSLLALNTNADIQGRVFDDGNVSSNTGWSSQKVSDELSNNFATADNVSFNNAGTGLAATTAQGAIEELDTDIEQNETNLNSHLNDTTDAHDASAVSFDNVASGLTANNVQAAIDEVEGRVDNKVEQSDIDALETSLKDGVPLAGDTLNKLYNLIQGIQSIDKTYPDIAARDADTGNVINGEYVFVVDASADVTVTSGWAIYRWNGVSYDKIQEQEGLDLVLEAAAITYDNTTSGLTAINVKAALDELVVLLAGKTEEAPNDGTQYVRQNEGWAEIVVDPVIQAPATISIDTNLAVDLDTFDFGTYTLNADLTSFTPSNGTQGKKYYIRLIQGATGGELTLAPIWQVSTAYAVGDKIVLPDGNIYKANTAHTSASNNYLGDIANWDIFLYNRGGTLPILNTKEGKIDTIELFKEENTDVYSFWIYYDESDNGIPDSVTNTTSDTWNVVNIVGSGIIEATSFLVTGGPSTGFLKADGSVDTNTYVLSSELSDYVPASTGGTFSGAIRIDSTLTLAPSANVNALTLSNSGFNNVIRFDTSSGLDSRLDFLENGVAKAYIGYDSSEGVLKLNGDGSFSASANLSIDTSGNTTINGQLQARLSGAATASVTPIRARNLSNGSTAITLENSLGVGVKLESRVESAGAGTDDYSFVVGTAQNGVLSDAFTLTKAGAGIFEGYLFSKSIIYSSATGKALELRGTNNSIDWNPSNGGVKAYIQYLDNTELKISGGSELVNITASGSSTVARIESTVSGASRLWFRNTIATTDVNQLWSQGNEMVINANGAEVQRWANGNSIISGGLDVNTTIGSLIVPRLTTTQRNSLTAVAGMIIYNTTTGQHEGYDGTSWNAMY